MTTKIDEPENPADDGPDNVTLVRDVLVFQFKLIVDGFRDLILVPTSLIVGIVSLLSGKDGKPGDQFYRLLGVGKQSERWIDLFSAIDNAPKGSVDEAQFADRSIDELIKTVENYVVEETKKGGVTQQAKEHLDTILKAAGARKHSSGQSE